MTYTVLDCNGWTWVFTSDNNQQWTAQNHRILFAGKSTAVVLRAEFQEGAIDDINVDLPLLNFPSQYKDVGKNQWNPTGSYRTHKLISENVGSYRTHESAQNLRSCPALDAASNNLPKNFLFIGTSSSPQRSVLDMEHGACARCFKQNRTGHPLDFRRFCLWGMWLSCPFNKHSPSISINLHLTLLHSMHLKGSVSHRPSGPFGWSNRDHQWRLVQYSWAIWSNRQ